MCSVRSLFHALRPNLSFLIYSQSNPLSHLLHHNLTTVAANVNLKTVPRCIDQIQTVSNLAQTITTHLQSCTNLPHLNQIHGQMIRSRLLERDPSQVHWNSIIRLYVRLASPRTALRVYARMSRAGILPDSYTLPIALKAACQVLEMGLGRQIHSVCIKCGLEHNEFCESGLVSLYAKDGEFNNALQLFEENSDRKLGSWNAIIGGFAQAGYSAEAVNMFFELRKCGLVPDDVTIVSVASACGSLGDLNLARQIHKCAFQARNSAKTDVVMFNSLIDMYGKCGQMDLAYKVFVGMAQRNVSTWTSMIMGLGMNGHIKDAVDYFCCMREAEVRPNHVTFVALLSACVHGGLVEEGRHYFEMMTGVYGLAPTLKHYGCMVDLLGRAGMLDEARQVVERMPMGANAQIWGALLGACEKYGYVEMAEWVAENLLELEPWNDGAYVVLSNIYAGAGLWDKVDEMRKWMNNRKVDKTPAFSLATTL